MHRTALALTGLAVVALGGTGIAVANAEAPSTPSAPSAPAPPAAAAPAKHKQHPTLHADAVRRGKGGTFVTHGTQRGTLTAVTPTSLTVRSADGFERTYVLGPDAKVKVDSKDASAADLKVGEKVGLASVASGSTWTVTRARAHS